MASNKKDRSRNFSTRGLTDKDGKYTQSLSSDLPKPNILRIEVLDGNSRQRYLASVQRKADEIRNNVYKQATLPSERVFYGFLVDGSETGFNMSTQWNDHTGSGAILGELKGLAGAVPGINNVVGGASEVIDRIGQIGGSLLGVNSSTTGSGTVKDFDGVSLQDYNLKCGWYLPEQYLLCIKSLKNIYRMAYPKQTNIESLSNAMKQSIGYQSEIDSATDDDGNILPSIDTVLDKGTEVLTNFASTVMQIQEDFGANYTFNPLPVRVSVGQYMDIEPLVITSVNTSFSKETFINYSGKETGRHLPITVTVDISFQYWLNPAPDLEFTSLLGEELFGVDAVPGPYKQSTDDYLGGEYGLHIRATSEDVNRVTQDPTNKIDVAPGAAEDAARRQASMDAFNAAETAKEIALAKANAPSKLYTPEV